MAQREVDATAQMVQVRQTELCEQFGTVPVSNELLERFQRVTGRPAHPFLRRGLYFAHRDLDAFLDAYESGRPVYVYTGRGPSSDALHLGHMVPFFFAKYLQECFGCYVMVQLTDDEKLLRDGALDFAQIDSYALSNARDILACGFVPERTFIFLNSYYIGHVYRFACEFERAMTLSALRATFGFPESCNVGYVSFPPKEMQPAFYRFFPHVFTAEYCAEWARGHRPADHQPAAPTPVKQGMTRQQRTALERRLAASDLPPDLQPYCLIPSGYEQDPYFRLARDIAAKLGLPKPATIYNSFIPALRGCDGKMSASDPSNAIYMDDTPAQIKNKINKYAFSGGKATVEEQRRLGADLSVDVSVKYLEVFMEDDDRLADIKRKYAAGEMLTGEVKKVLIEVLQEAVKQHQERKALITDEYVRQNVYGWGRSL